ncbi:MAG: hypothetical protein R3F65_14645 [bacterium]
MRLGEVLDRTEENADTETERPRRRFGLWIALWLCVGLAAVSWAHGPVVLFPEDDEAIVVYTPAALGVLGPPTQTVVDRPFVVRVPLAQRVARIDTAPRRVEVAGPAVADGVAVRLVGGEVTHRVRPADADGVIRRLGTDPAARDALMTALAHAVYAEAVGGLRLSDLADAGRIAAALDAARRRLGDRAAQHGIEAQVVTRPAAEVDPAAAGLLARIGEVEDRLAARRGDATESEADRRDDRLALDRRHRDERAQARVELDARIAAAERQVAEARVAGERVYAARLAAARAEAAALTAATAAVEVEGRLAAERARAGVAALGENGRAVLDHVIATQVMPQLARVRTGAPRFEVAELPPPAPLLPGPPAVAVEPVEAPRGAVERGVPGPDVAPGRGGDRDGAPATPRGGGPATPGSGGAPAMPERDGGPEAPRGDGPATRAPDGAPATPAGNRATAPPAPDGAPGTPANGSAPAPGTEEAAR